MLLQPRISYNNIIESYLILLQPNTNKVELLKDLTIDYIDTQKSAVFNGFGWDENGKFLKEI